MHSDPISRKNDSVNAEVSEERNLSLSIHPLSLVLTLSLSLSLSSHPLSLSPSLSLSLSLIHYLSRPHSLSLLSSIISLSLSLSLSLSQVSAMMNRMESVAAGLNVSLDHPSFTQALPPSSLQRFLRARPIPGLVLADHQASFNNRSQLYFLYCCLIINYSYQLPDNHPHPSNLVAMIQKP